ncbi:MAG TPA: hypothetical protein VI259_17020 [Gemmatimonadaceae bacterium]
MSRPEPAIDLDLIAAFIDGRLGPADRERAMTLLASSDAAFEVFVDASRARAEVGDGVIPIERGRRWMPGGRRTWWVLAPAAAAAVLLLVVVPKTGIRSGRDTSVSATSLVAALGNADVHAAAGPGVEGQGRDWSVTRGASTSLADSANAFRLGVRAIDLQVAVMANDRPSAERLAGEMLDRIAGIELSQFVAARYANLRRGIAGTQREQLLAEASQAEEALGKLLAGRPDDAFWFNFGKWSAAAELAAGAHSPAFFQSELSARVVGDALARGGGVRADTSELRRASDLARPNATDHDFQMERDALRSLIKKHAE